MRIPLQPVRFVPGPRMTTMGPGTDGLEVLGEDECLTLLTSADVGRVGVVVDGQPLIFPVNHVLAGRSIVVRTDSGTMLHAASLARVAFEADGRRHTERRSMTTLLIHETGDTRSEEPTLACGCCIPPPDASLPEGRQRALAELKARRDALDRRLERLQD